MKIFQVLILLILYNSLNIYSQIRNGSYYKIPMYWIDVNKEFVFHADSFEWNEYSMMGKKYSLGKWEIKNDALFLFFNRKPEEELVKIYRGSTKKNGFILKVYRSDQKPLLGADIFLNDYPFDIIRTRSGEININISDTIHKIKISMVGYQTLEIDEGLLKPLNGVDSIICNIKYSSPKYVERINCSMRIRNIDKNGFELLEKVGSNLYFIQYVTDSLFMKIKKEKGIPARNTPFEYEKRFLKY